MSAGNGPYVNAPYVNLPTVRRSEIETQLARSMLVGEVRDGDQVIVRWDDHEAKVRFERQPAAKPAEEATPAAAEARVH